MHKVQAKRGALCGVYICECECLLTFRDCMCVWKVSYQQAIIHYTYTRFVNLYLCVCVYV